MNARIPSRGNVLALLVSLAVSSAMAASPSSQTPPNLDILRFRDGTPVETPDDWARRREELAEAILVPEYGALPPAPSAGGVAFEDVGGRRAKLTPDGPRGRYLAGLVTVGGGAMPFTFRLDILLPPGDGPFPVVLTGDGCWRFQEHDMAYAAVGRGMAYAQFNRCEIARDSAAAPATAGARAAFPGPYGALAFWAWGYHRAIDALVTLPFVDASRIAATGHSRGGKAVLLAAATDPRIALVADSGSGCGGAGSFHVEGAGCEKVAAITKNFPHWFNPAFAEWSGRDADLPFDQHFLKALIAPRALLSLGGRGDTWANPEGTLATHEAARPAWTLLGAPDAIALSFREGGHGYKSEDWTRFLDFTSRHFFGEPPAE